MPLLFSKRKFRHVKSSQPKKYPVFWECARCSRLSRLVGRCRQTWMGFRRSGSSKIYPLPKLYLPHNPHDQSAPADLGYKARSVSPLTDCNTPRAKSSRIRALWEVREVFQKKRWGNLRFPLTDPGEATGGSHECHPILMNVPRSLIFYHE